MCNIVSKRCIYDGCKKLATFNCPGNKTPTHCFTHKTTEMVDVINKQCFFDGCRLQPAFNYQGEKNGLYCGKHRLDNMVCIRSKKCEIDNCNLFPIYNFVNEKYGIFCNTHKLEDMIDVRHSICQYEGCGIRPTYNTKEENTPLFCKLHKSVDMVNVVSKFCKNEDCNKQPNFNYVGEKTGMYCLQHKQPDMVDVKHIKCLTHLCTVRAIDKYDGYCARCFVYLFPDKPNARNYKTKERSVVDYVLSRFPDFTWVSDKKIQEGCSKRRPDLLLDLGYQIVIVEIDENQHLDYDCSCENKRVMEISQDLGHRPIVFIRFNPDGYVTKEGKKISSFWNIDGNGVCAINKKNTEKWQNRLDSLCEQIVYWSHPEHKTDKTIENVHLFYDEIL
jgi:hypothetical protein